MQGQEVHAPHRFPEYSLANWALLQVSWVSHCKVRFVVVVYLII